MFTGPFLETCVSRSLQATITEGRARRGGKQGRSGVPHLGGAVLPRAGLLLPPHLRRKQAALKADQMGLDWFHLTSPKSSVLSGGVGSKVTLWGLQGDWSGGSHPPQSRLVPRLYAGSLHWQVPCASVSPLALEQWLTSWTSESNCGVNQAANGQPGRPARGVGTLTCGTCTLSKPPTSARCHGDARHPQQHLGYHSPKFKRDTHLGTPNPKGSRELCELTFL